MAKEAQKLQEIKVAKVVDSRGTLCPLPVIQVSRAIKELQPGEVVKLLATDPGSPPDMQAWVKQTGHTLIKSGTEDGAHVFYVQKARERRV